MSREVEKLLSQLVEENSLKAWSLIITFFGDAIVARGGNVSAKTVQSVLSEAGMSAGAVRTAFSRLAGDQWIMRQKIGRESYYELADNGYQPFKAAALRIYSPVAGNNFEPSSWLLAVKNPGAKVTDADLLKQGMQITSNCWLFNNAGASTKTVLSGKGYLLVSGPVEDFPEWITDKLLPKAHASGYLQLQKRFSIIKNAESLDPLQSLVVRCLLIHQWRRLLLRSLVLPNDMVPADWPENACREFVADLYQRLLPGSEAWLEKQATCADGALPSASIDIKLRFTEQFSAAIKNDY